MHRYSIKKPRGWPGFFALVVVVVMAGAGRARGTDNIGDIAVSAAAIYTGQTFHGYAETRVALENDSSKTHVVTLSTPHQSYNSGGNSIGRVSRTVTLPPGVQVVETLLQPPLPAQGDDLLQVSVDGRDEGTIRQPNPDNHCSGERGGLGQGATAFLSRSVDADAVERMLNLNHSANSAAMAAGRPSFWFHGRSKVWMPDASVAGRTNWLELDYSPPVAATHLIVYYDGPSVVNGYAELVGVSGANVARFDLSTGKLNTSRSPGGSHSAFDYSIPAIPEPVKTVRLNYGMTPPTDIGVGAVELDDARGMQNYATAARASSENKSAGSPGGSPDDPNAIRCLRAESALADWSDNWLAYSPFDVIVLGARDVTAMPAPVAVAIGDYLQAGGNVVIIGANNLPATWNPLPADNLPAGLMAQAGFGHGFAISQTNPAQVDVESLRLLNETILAAARYWASLPGDSGAANIGLPVVESVRIPTRGITLVMLSFIVIVGPLNIFLLARKNKRIWTLWTIPAISVLTTALIFAYSLAREGITPNTRMAGLTVLDQRAHHAATYGALGLYCPLTPGDGLRFDNETEVTPLVSSGYDEPGAEREVDWTQTQHFQRGWVSSRVPAHFHLRKSGVRRERLEWQAANGGWQIINGLGVPVKSLWLADKDMKFYHAENVPAGQPVTLSAVKGPVAPGRQGPGALLRDFGYHAESAGSNPMGYLQPGSYIAVLDGNPFIENALGAAASARRTHGAGVVYGILDPPANP